MKRIAKSPEANDNPWGAWSGHWYNNQGFINLLVLSLENPKHINAAICWADTSEGHDFWAAYCYGRSVEPQRTRIKAMIEELSIPLKPFNKGDWL